MEQKTRKSEGVYAANWYFDLNVARDFRVYALAFWLLLFGLGVLVDAISRF